MSLTTQCPACRTTFKIVPDQLKISDGWVRCGHCADVFDATRYLDGEVAAPVSAPVPLPVQEPATARPPASRAPRPDSASSRHDEEEEGEGDWLLAPKPRNAPDSRQHGSGFQASRSPSPVAPASRPMERPPEPLAVARPSPVPQPAPVAVAPPPAPSSPAPRTRAAQSSSEPDSVFAPSSSFSHSVLTEEEFVDQLRSFVSASAKAKAQEGGREQESSLEKEAQRNRPVSQDSLPRGLGRDEDEADASTDGEEPGFVRQARRRAFWRSGAMRVALALVSLLLALTLTGQWVIHERDVLASRYPGAAPVIEVLCQVAGCELGPVRQIESVVIDSSNLVRRLGNFYAFDFVLKNNAQLPVAVPALELSLTDSRDNVISRRVFLAEELPGAPAMLPAQGSVSMSLRLTINDTGLSAMTGYRALVFYP